VPLHPAAIAEATTTMQTRDIADELTDRCMVDLGARFKTS